MQAPGVENQRGVAAVCASSGAAKQASRRRGKRGVIPGCVREASERASSTPDRPGAVSAVTHWTLSFIIFQIGIFTTVLGTGVNYMYPETIIRLG